MRIASIVALGLVLAGCGSDKSESLPAACTAGEQAIVDALAKAPARVTLDGTPISQCFKRDASGQDIQILGTSLLAAAQQLADRGQALQLGYLTGAAQRGAKRSGLGDELIRRIQAEADGVGAHRAAYARGLRAGLAQG